MLPRDVMSSPTTAGAVCGGIPPGSSHLSSAAATSVRPSVAPAAACPAVQVPTSPGAAPPRKRHRLLGKQAQPAFTTDLGEVVPSAPAHSASVIGSVPVCFGHSAGPAVQDPTFSGDAPPRKRTRLIGKQLRPAPAVTPHEVVLRDSVVDELGCGAEAKDAKRMVYLVTLPHTFRKDLVAPETLSKHDVLRKMRDSLAAPAYANSGNASTATPVKVLKLVVARENHLLDAQYGAVHKHDHIAVLASVAFRFLPVKRALLWRHGLASHWSCSHDGYHSAVRYLVVPSPKKPASALDPAPLSWCPHGAHPPLLDEAQEPSTCAAMRRRRESKISRSGARKGRPTGGRD